MKIQQPPITGIPTLDPWLQRLPEHFMNLGWVDIRDHGATCNGSDNDLIAIENAATVGSYIRLPKNTLCILDGSGSWAANGIPANLFFIGEDWETVVFKSNNVTTASISVGANTSLSNVAFYHKFGEDIKLNIPGDVNAPLPVRFFFNNTSSTVNPTNWYKHTILVHTGEAGEDRPAISIINEGIGDAIWTGVINNGIGMRSDVAHGVGIYIPLGAIFDVASGSGAITLRTSTNKTVHADAKLLFIEPQTDHQSIYIAPTVDTARDIGLVTGTKTAGEIINMYQSASAFSGYGMLMNFGTGGGSYSGAFVVFKKNGVDKFYVLHDGSIHMASFIEGNEIADPAAPAANKGRLYFRDNGAGKTQLVARFPTGTVQVIATEP